MKILGSLIWSCSAEVRLALIKAELIPQIINTLNPLSLSFTEAEDLHINLIKIIGSSLRLMAQDALTYLTIEDRNGQPAVHETVLKQVLIPFDKYIWHLCANRYSIMDGILSLTFMFLLAQILRTSLYYQPKMDFVLNMPAFLTIPSLLTYFENENSIWSFLYDLNEIQQKLNKPRGGVRQMGWIVHRMLRMEGMEDVMEEMQRNSKNRHFGGVSVAKSIEWNNLQGMNVPKLW
ncbi:hypothetical protein BLNAU_21012 [Blattamonas nauphoetae]|uniref:Uncharacterized protein n=1 Tax=Blattamonas nauphoetae TaxID=2049346 RepID=A0ABQ9WX35_9EUKA|nr:hypothetical protein BLNAU_21012 [Blattamonas nauphoetae]